MSGKNKTSFALIIFIIVSFTAYVFLGQRIALAADSSEEVRLSIEKAALPQGAKKTLSLKADEAVRSGISPDDVSVIIGRGLQRNLDHKTIEGLIDAVIKVKSRGLPARPVLDRIQQGISKGIPSARLLSSTNGLAEKLAVANNLVGSVIKSGVKADRGKEEAVQTVATALEKSISEGVIAQTGNKVRTYNYSIPMFSRAVDVITTLSENGLSEKQASHLVDKAIDKGYSEKDLLMLEREVSNDMREGRRTEDTMNRLESMINRGAMSPGKGMMGNGPMKSSGSMMGSPPQPGGSFSSGPGFSHGPMSPPMRGR